FARKRCDNKNGRARPGRWSHGNHVTVSRKLLRRGRQRNRIIRQRVQIIDHVGALAVLLDAGKAHRGARDKTLRVVDELVEVVIGPGAALGLHRGREVEAAAFALLVADDAVEVRADAIRAALLEGVAGAALLG